MALFGSKKNTTQPSAGRAKKSASKEVAVVSTGKNMMRDLASVIKHARVTEKAALQAEKGIYVFQVSTDSTKASIMSAIKELYNVTPVSVRVAAIPDKKIFSRGAWGTKRGGKKAYVYLKKGETIEFV